MQQLQCMFFIINFLYYIRSTCLGYAKDYYWSLQRTACIGALHYF